MASNAARHRCVRQTRLALRSDLEILAGSKHTPDQKTAVSDTLKASLKSLSTKPMVRDAAAKALGPKLGGILALLG